MMLRDEMQSSILFLLDNPINEDIACSQLVKLIDTDNVYGYISGDITRITEVTKNINNSECYRYIAQN